MSWDTDVCRSCDAEIRWATHHERESRMPFDAEPVETRSKDLRGLWHLEDMDDGSLKAYPAKPTDSVVYRSHHATCPDAARWRGQHR